MTQKLLVFHQSIPPYRIDFFNALYQKYSCSICVFKRGLNGQKLDNSKLEERHLFKAEYFTEKNRFFRFLPKGVWKKICKENPNVILVNECGPVSILAVFYKFLQKLQGHKVKVISMIDDSFDMTINKNMQFSKRHEIVERFLIPRFDEVIFVDNDTAAYYKKKYNIGTYMPIVNEDNIARDRYTNVLNISNEYIHKYNLKNKKVILFVGRLVKLKNLQFVIPTILKSNDENIRLIVVGSGEYENELKELAQNSNKIIFTGQQEGDKLLAFYNVAQVFILPSYQEAFGAVTNEALLAGCYSLVSNKAGSRNLIIDGVNGRLFDPYDNNAFETLLANILERTTPIDIPVELKPNLIPKTFNEYFKNIENII